PDLNLTPQTHRTICQGETIQATAEYFGGVSPIIIEWFALPNTSSPISVSPTTNLNPTTTTNYRLVVRDECVARQSDFTVTVIPGDLALSPIIALPGTTVCSGTTVTLSANASGGSGNYQYQWTPSGPNSGTAQFVVAQAGVYSLSVSDGCNTRSQSVQINLAPDLALNVSGTATICPGASVNLSATASGALAPGTAPVWRDAAGNIVGAGNPTVSPSVSTVYTASVSDTCGNTLSESVSITVRPSLVLNELEDRTICQGESTTYSAVASGAGTLVYSWAGPNGNVGSGAASITLAPASSATYTLTVSDECASRSETFTVNVYPANLSVGGVTAPATVCRGTVLNFNPVVTGGTGNYQYAWTAGQSTPGISVVIESDTTIGLTVSDGCQTVQQSATISVVPRISINAYGDTAICPVTGVATLRAVVENAFGTQTPVQWFDQNGNLVGTGANIVVTPSATATYYAEVSDQCATAQSGVVTVVVLPSATLQPIDDATICEGETVHLSA
ncbi:MAG: hypothetical protein RMM53_02680, partial [Bacteroidia bacterium]|nr:hypothetical protein [Bacteroidia bacterium]